MKFTFGVNHTKHGCTVWMEGPSGHRYKARFRNGYASALTSAENWVWEKRQSLKQEAELTGKSVEFDVPTELDRFYDRKSILLSVELWREFEEAAKAEGISLSAWIEKAGKSQLKLYPVKNADCTS